MPSKITQQPERKVPADLLSVAAYAELRTLSRAYLWKEIREKRLPAYRIGGGRLLFVGLREADEAIFVPTMGGDA